MGRSLAVVLPVPDFSMPYNVTCLVLVVVLTLVLGSASVMRSAAGISSEQRRRVSKGSTAL